MRSSVNTRSNHQNEVDVINRDNRIEVMTFHCQNYGIALDETMDIDMAMYD